MRNSVLLTGVFGLLCGTAALASAAEPSPKIGPAPAWVQPVTVPAADPRLKSLPAQVLITSTQERLTPSGVETYLEYAAVAQTVAGLQSVGIIALPWNVARTDLTLHRIEIKRGDKIIDQLDPKELVILRRENNLEKAMLDGIRTVVLPTRGLRVGDQVNVAVTYRTKPSTMLAAAEDLQSMTMPAGVLRLERSFLVPNDVAVKWYMSPGITSSNVTTLPGGRRFSFASAGAKTPDYPAGTPARFKDKVIQVSAWNSWSDVASRMLPLFAEARKITPGSSLDEEANRIAQLTSDASKRMLAALNLAQEQVRYVALLLGEGAYVPKSAEESWDRRFGDCKGKTSLLLALLDRYGITAEPMLVSHSMDDSLSAVQPTLALFDHVIVRAQLDGKTYYLDPTDYGQRTLEELSRTSFRHGLPLAGGKLIALESPLPAEPLSDVEISWNGAEGFERKVPFSVTMRLRGEAAARMRAKRVSSEDADEFAQTLKNLVPGIGNDKLTLAADEPEQEDGSYLVRFTGESAMDWEPVEGLKGHRFQFDQSGVAWKAEFKRAEEANKHLPVQLEWPYFQRLTETIILPAHSKPFKVDAKPIDRTFAGLKVTRSVQALGDRIVARSEFRHLQREIGADEARTAEEMLGKISEEYAYLVAPGKIRPVQEEAVAE